MLRSRWAGLRPAHSPPHPPSPIMGPRTRVYHVHVPRTCTSRTCAFITYIFHVHGCSINIHFTRTRVGACACCTYKRLYKYCFCAPIHPADRSSVGNAAAFCSLLLGSYVCPPSPAASLLLLLVASLYNNPYDIIITLDEFCFIFIYVFN